MLPFGVTRHRFAHDTGDLIKAIQMSTKASDTALRVV